MDPRLLPAPSRYGDGLAEQIHDPMDPFLAKWLGLLYMSKLTDVREGKFLQVRKWVVPVLVW
jgi:hypothetical protein